MLKTTILDLRIPIVSIKNSIKSRWFPLLVFFPLALYGLYRIFENRIISILISFFPKEPGKSIEFYRDFINVIFTELLWVSAFFLLAWALVIYAPLPRFFHTTETVIQRWSTIAVATIVFSSFLMSLHISVNTLERFANSSDEYAYLYQAKTMGSGKLWEFAHDHPDFFYFNHIAQKDGISVGRFPPGWPLVLSTAYYFNFDPAFVNPILGLITLILFYSFVRRFYSWKVAFWSVTALSLSSFYMFNAASYFSHTSCALFVVGFVYGTYAYLDKQHPLSAILAGLCIGMVLITRYYTAVLLFVPLAGYICWRTRWKCIGTFAWMAVGGIPCLAFLLWYNYSITGNAFLPVTMWAYADESLGFVRGHSILKGTEHVIRWTGMFIYWCSPGLLILYVIGLIQKVSSKADRWIRPEDYFYLILVVGYFFYYQIGGNQYGPRFFFEALPFLVVFVVNRMFQLKAKWAMALFAAGLVYAVVKIPFITSRENQVVAERNDLYRMVKDQRIQNAVVFISSYTSVIRPMPIGDLTRNDAFYMNDVLYAIDLQERNQELIDYYPDRTFYRYVRETDLVEGSLERIK